MSDTGTLAGGVTIAAGASYLWVNCDYSSGNPVSAFGIGGPVQLDITRGPVGYNDFPPEPAFLPPLNFAPGPGFMQQLGTNDLTPTGTIVI